MWDFSQNKLTAYSIFFLFLISLIAGAYCGYTLATKEVTQACNKYIEVNYANQSRGSANIIFRRDSGLNFSFKPPND
jgi:hypothetical protein